MNDPKKLKIVIAVLLVGLFTSVGFLGHALLENMMWRSEVDSLARYQGSTRARHDFQLGRLRLFVISGERSDDKFSGTNGGPFEIWFPQYFPESSPLRLSTETMVAAYNDRMRYMQQHPERYPFSTNATPQKAIP
ncbi:MAG: hypothetical protein ACXWC8_01305 [Limisphaerales bacterium]